MGIADQTDHDPWPSPLFRDIVEELQTFNRRKTNIYPHAILEASAFAILLVLADGRARTLRELTEELELEQSTVNRQVNSAINHGYLERFEVPGSVSRMIRPTPAGQEAFEHDGQLRVERLNRVFDDLAPGTPEGLLRELRAFNQAYQRTVDRSTERSLR
ncbi:MarR family winged helix-turn-helix transcriptional regulator [Gordonia soli]|uniref:Putative MarR family transcriptional regulator n=1 Tax=Gordonia soli NBRC 108243 TaxID=1223545 RepID=M0QFE9_9ACTN|nr:MarR family winged helix-turn-helix transcriptional regulator [Gordonia soli]GAC67325.1 putative MarR family transcriptional regulator [Gordonia soli NBRC 108243]